MKINPLFKLTMLLLFFCTAVFGQSSSREILANQLNFYPMTQSVSGNSGEDILATVLVTCTGGSPEPITFNITPCNIDGGYVNYITNNGTILYPGDNSTITFKFKKTITSTSSFTYKFAKDNSSCASDGNLLKITVTYNFVTAPVCSLTTPTPIINNISSGAALASWSNITGNSGYKFEIRKSSQSVYNTISLSTNINSTNLNGLEPSTNYYWRMATKCSNGSYSTYSSGVFATAACVSGTPLLNDATNITDYSADFSWSNISNNIGYYLYFRKTTDYGWTIKSLNPNVTNFTATTLQWNSTYEYKVATKCGGGANGIFSGTKTLNTLNSTSFAFPSDVAIGTINAQDRVELYYGNGRKTTLQNIYAKKIDLFSSKIFVGISTTDYPFAVVDGIYWDLSLPSNVVPRDISIGKPFQYNSDIASEAAIYAAGTDNKVYYKQGFYFAGWTVIKLNMDSYIPWTGDLESIETSSFYSFYLKDSNGNCIRCHRQFNNPYTNTMDCFPVSINNSSTRGIGASYENYLTTTPPNNTPSFNLAMYRAETNNTITYHYSLSDGETESIQKPASEPQSCTKCLIDGYKSTTGIPDNMVYLPNDTGYYYGSAGWLTIASGIKDISIGAFDGVVGDYGARLANLQENMYSMRPEEKISVETIGQVIVFPNPANKTVTVNFSEIVQPTDIEYLLTDTFGNNIISASKNTIPFSINVGNISNGIYILKITWDTGMISKKVIIRH